MSACSPRYVIVAKRERAPSNARCESLPLGRVWWYVTTLRPRSAMTLRDLIEREGGGIVREPQGIETPPPGKSSERPRSKRREPDLRNVEAEGSSPFTSTKGPGQRVKVEPPEGHKAPLSATCFVVELEDASWPHSPKDQVTSRRPDLRHSGMCDWAARVFTCLYGQIDRPVVESSRWVKGAVCEHEVGLRVGGRRSHYSPSARVPDRSASVKKSLHKIQGESLFASCPGILAIWPQYVRS